MAQLSTAHREFIVRRLAVFDTPSEVRDRVRDRFGVEVSLDQVCYYNPESANGSDRLAPKWVTLFETTRRKYLEDTASIPAAHKAYRVRELHDMAEKAKEMGNYPLVADLYEQIAKEMGDAYTNTKLVEMSGKDGGPLQITGIDFGADSDDGGEA